MIEVSLDEARRIAVRSQLLDGSATDVLSTVKQLGFLQIDPISTVAPPQHLVLWSRLGSKYDRDELARLLWEEKKLLEYNAFIYPIEDLPALLARMRRRRNKYAWEIRGNEFLRTHAKFKRQVLRDIELNGPMLSRRLEGDLRPAGERPVWWGRQVTLMLEILHGRGVLAIVGREGNQRVWDLAERWYPQVEPMSLREADAYFAEKRARALGVQHDTKTGRWLAHPDATDGKVSRRTTLLSPFDRLIHDRDRAERLFDLHYRLEMYVPKAKREYGYYVLPLLVGNAIPGRAEPVFDKKTRTLRLVGAWGDTKRLDKPLADLGKWLGATTIER